MKKILLLFAVLFSIGSIAQVTNEGVPMSWDLLNDSKSFNANVLPGFDLEAVTTEDAINDPNFDRPWRFGFMHSVDYGFDQGQWTTLDNGDRIWRILIESPDALSINVIFDEFYMPNGGNVYLYNDDRSDLLGAYTATQNQESGILATWLVQGDALWIEYYEPAAVLGKGKLHIAKATHGYRNADTFTNSRALNDSGDCNLDVDCPIGADWEQLKDLNKRSAGILLSGGSGFCSGALVNNTNNDGTPYFLTANHCFSNPAAWAFRFGWISPDPVCAATTNSTNGPTNMTISGGTLRARSGNSDFCLVEINSAIPPAWDRVYAGWDSTDSFPTFQVGIHHPSGDIMKVCRDDNPATKEVNAGAQTWEIVGGASGGWELGVTEPGSSGSPLFDQNGRVIGQLFGGAAACSGVNDNGAFDYYGRFGVSWDGASAATRLRDWLDPSGLNPGTWDSNPPFMVFALDGAVGASIPDVACGDSAIEPTITLSNLGMTDITAATITWDLDGGTTTTINFSGVLMQNQNEMYSLGTIPVSAGTHTLNVTLVDVNGVVDDNTGNNGANPTVEIDDTAFETNQVHLALLTDDWAEETSWEFRDSNGTVLYNGGPYQQNIDDNTLFEEDFDVNPNECYYFEIFDTAGDGICCGFGLGNYALTTDNGTIIFEGGEFGSSELTEMRTGGPLSINDLLSGNVVIFPNPTSDILNINFTDVNGDFEYTITNALGQIVKTEALSSNVNTVDVALLSSGLYFVTINDKASNVSMVQKLIKK